MYATHRLIMMYLCAKLFNKNVYTELREPAVWKTSCVESKLFGDPSVWRASCVESQLCGDQLCGEQAVRRASCEESQL